MIFKKYKSVCIGIVATLVLMGCQNSETKVQAQSSDKAANEAKVVLTEYSDFQCPACAYFFPMVEKLKKEYGDKLEVNYRYFPLNSHQFAMLAARAAEAARNQGKFQEMHDLLFQNQRQWSSSGNPQPTFVNYAKRIGLDVSQFKEDLNAAETQKEVIEQKKKGIERGVDSTPTFYINGEEMVTLPRTYEQFKAQVDIYMKEAEQAAN
jgi:protein-disulfide isomerase